MFTTRNLFTYDGNENVIETISQSRDGLNWVNHLRSLFSYNGNGNLIEQINQFWDGANWTNGLRILHSYDGSENNIEVLFQLWDGSIWGNSGRDTFSHDGSGNVIEEISEFWDGTMWVGVTKCNTTWEMTTGIEDVSGVIKDFELYNYPNPFNPSTTISYRLRTGNRIKLTIFDILGHEITTLVDEQQAAGAYSVSFNASQLAGGVYFYRLQAGQNIQTRKMLLVK